MTALVVGLVASRYRLIGYAEYRAGLRADVFDGSAVLVYGLQWLTVAMTTVVAVLAVTRLRRGPRTPTRTFWTLMCPVVCLCALRVLFTRCG